MVAASVIVLVTVLADEYLLRCPLVFIPQELIIALHFCLWAIEYRIVDLWRALVRGFTNSDTSNDRPQNVTCLHRQTGLTNASRPAAGCRMHAG